LLLSPPVSIPTSVASLACDPVEHRRRNQYFVSRARSSSVVARAPPSSVVARAPSSRSRVARAVIATVRRAVASVVATRSRVGAGVVVASPRRRGEMSMNLARKRRVWANSPRPMCDATCQ
jgi:hypothetical protein